MSVLFLWSFDLHCLKDALNVQIINFMRHIFSLNGKNELWRVRLRGVDGDIHQHKRVAEHERGEKMRTGIFSATHGWSHG